MTQIISKWKQLESGLKKFYPSKNFLWTGVVYMWAVVGTPMWPHINYSPVKQNSNLTCIYRKANFISKWTSWRKVFQKIVSNSFRSNFDIYNNTYESWRFCSRAACFDSRTFRKSAFILQSISSRKKQFLCHSEYKIWYFFIIGQR